MPAGRFLLVVEGGSLGARRLNDATVGLAKAWASRGDVTIYHVAGERNLEEARREAAGLGLGPQSSPEAGLDYRLVGYERRMPTLLAACDFAVCRAGALTVAELAAIGTPSALVPLPGAPNDHQTRNAEALSGVGAAILIADDDCSAERLEEMVAVLARGPGPSRVHEHRGRGGRSSRRRRAGGRASRVAVEGAVVNTPNAPQVDLSVPLNIHVVGVGGAGMSAIAGVLAGMGHHVTGSDIKSSLSLERLAALGVEVEIGHRRENVVGADALTYSTAVSERNLEITEARRLGIPVLSRAAMLEAIAALRRTVAVAGTHGKTTTSSMLALVLVEAGLRPSFIIGGEVNEMARTRPGTQVTFSSSRPTRATGRSCA